MRNWTSALTIALLLAGAAHAKKIATIAGTGQQGFAGDGQPALESKIDNPFGVVIGPDKALYFAEYTGQRIRRLDSKTQKLSTVAGSGEKGYSGDGGPALKASFRLPHELRFDRAGNIYIADMENHAIRRVDAKTGVITTVAGTGVAGFSGDGGPGVKAQLKQPHSIQFDREGRLLICDIGNHRIRRLDTKTGLIETFAGTGARTPTPDGSKREGTALNGPRSIDTDPAGNLYIVLREGNSVYKLDAKTDTYHHLAGTGEKGYTGDGADARKAKLSGPKGIAWSREGAVYIADTESHTVRRIDLKSGIIETAAGTGEKGVGADGDPADGDPRKCKLARPHGVYVGRKGELYIGDSETHRVRVVR